MLKVAVFDFGGVLGSDADEWSTTFKEVLDYSGLSKQEMLPLWEKHWPLLKINKEPVENYWIEVAKKNNVDAEKIREIYNRSMRVNQEVLNFAESLKEKYRIVILSNDADDWMDAKIKRFKLDKIFDKIYSSASLGISKPDKKIFERVLTKEKIQPHEMLFIDNQENNIEIARELGIKTMLFQSYSQLKRNLEKLGIIGTPS